MKRVNRGLGWAAALLICPLAVFAQQADAPTATGETGLFTLVTPHSVAKGGWSFGLYYNNWDRLVEDTDHLTADWHRLSAAVGYGITDDFEIAISVPYEKIDFAGTELDGDGLGNARLGAKYRLFHDPDKGTAFAINAFVEAPTGDDDVASDDAGYGVALSWAVKRFVVDVGYREPGDDDAIERKEEASVGFGYAAPVSDRMDWITELVGTFPTGDGFAWDDSIDLATGGRLWLGDDRRWAFNFALRADLAQVDEFDDHCPLGGVLGLSFIPALGSAKAVEPPPPPPPPPPPAPPEPPPAPPTPPPPPPPPPAPAPRPEIREVVNFDSGSARLSNIAKAKLDEVALKMKQDPELRALVIGYSDATGSTGGNQRLSEQRATAVKTYLVQRHGLDGSRIAVEGRGAAEPAAANDTAAGRKENRRAVVILKIE